MKICRVHFVSRYNSVPISYKKRNACLENSKHNFSDIPSHSGSLFFPFLSLYVAQRFDVGMTEVGLIFGIWSFSSLIGSMIGGALADKFGRKVIIIFGLVSSALTGILMGLVSRISSFYVLAV